MQISNKTLDILTDLINEKSQYRSGSKLVDFFNQLGFNDVYPYGQGGFPSRKDFTIEKLRAINGTPEMDKCLRNLFAPIEFATEIPRLDDLIKEFNLYLVFDGWKVVRNNTEITFKRVSKIDLDGMTTAESIETEEDFLKRHYAIDLSSLSLSGPLETIIEARINEVTNGLTYKMPLSAIILAGSSLEGILLDLATKNPKDFNQARSAPIDSTTGKPRHFQEWSLANFIDVAYELGYLREDVKKFSHALRDFRNFIHPFEQMSKNFSPSINTAQLCVQALKAAIVQITGHR